MRIRFSSYPVLTKANENNFYYFKRHLSVESLLPSEIYWGKNSCAFFGSDIETVEKKIDLHVNLNKDSLLLFSFVLHFRANLMHPVNMMLVKDGVGEK